MNQEDKIKLLGKETRRLSSIMEYLVESELQVGRVNKELADEIYGVRLKIREVKIKLENSQDNISYMMKRERDNNTTIDYEKLKNGWCFSGQSSNK